MLPTLNINLYNINFYILTHKYTFLNNIKMYFLILSISVLLNNIELIFILCLNYIDFKNNFVFERIKLV